MPESTTDLPLLHQFIGKIGKHNFQGTVLALDPGETTGLTQITRYPDRTVLRHYEQLPGWPIEDFLKACKAGEYFRGLSWCVYEAYHVYAWRLAEHTFSEVPTIQIIGAIKTLCIQEGVPYSNQTAQVGKAFFTDERLKALGLYYKGKQHARDSLRHACQFLCFGTKA